MTSNADTQLPHFLKDAWSLDDSSLRQAAVDNSIGQWNVTSLCENQVEWRIQEHNRLLWERELLFHAVDRAVTSEGAVGAATLASLCTAKIISLLEESNDVAGDITTLLKHLSWTSIRHILGDPRLPYRLLRSFLAASRGTGSTDAVDTARAAVDVDELVLANERYIRSRGPERNKDGRYLVRFEHPETLFEGAREDPHSDQLIISRIVPPKGGLELFDVHRPQRLYIQPDANAFVRTFNRITRNILQGLNWQNVFVAGGMVLRTLLHVDPGKDTAKEVQDGDIDVYLYGLNPVQANDKVREIYQVWSQNLPSNNGQRLIVKNTKTITFLSDYPNRRIQIVLKLVSSPTSLLLNFDLDPCAMGFDGTDIFMLPRAARCLETGYTTFTMDLICGHHLHDRRATDPTRIFKYADRGFGIRILPSYVRVLEDIKLRGAGMPEVDHHKTQLEPRKAFGQEPGLKTLKRIAYMGKDLVHRQCFGVTELPIIADGSFDDAAVRDYVEKQKRKKACNDSKRARGQMAEKPVIDLRLLDSACRFEDLPEKRIRIGDFDRWMQHHEAWRLDAVGEAILDVSYASSNAYVNTYDDMPTYEWHEYFDANQFAHGIDSYNNSLFENLKHDICDITGIPYQRTGWRDYLTRRIRRIVYGGDIDTVFEKQITLPLLIPYDLEVYLEHQTADALSEAQSIFTVDQDRLLIPVHEAGQGTVILPDLQDRGEPSGDVRYWVIGNELMWAGIHRTLDEVAEILWKLFYWTHASRMDDDGTVRPPSRLDQRSAVMFLADRFLDRITLPSDSPVSKGHGRRIRSTAGSVPEREARLFQQWVCHRPKPASGDLLGLLGSLGLPRVEHPRRLLVMDNVVQYPPVDELFWRDSEEESEL